MKVYELVDALMDSAVGSEVVVDEDGGLHRVVRVSASQDSDDAAFVACEPAYPVGGDRG